jgi:hypothetical protein
MKPGSIALATLAVAALADSALGQAAAQTTLGKELRGKS